MLLTYCVRSRFIVGILRVLRRRWKQSKVEIKELHMVPCCSSRLLWCSLSLLLLSDSFVPLCFGCCCCCCSQIVSNQIAAGAAADLFLICLLPGCCCWCWELRRIERIRSCDTLFTSSSSLLCSALLFSIYWTSQQQRWREAAAAAASGVVWEEEEEEEEQVWVKGWLDCLPSCLPRRVDSPLSSVSRQ